MVVAGAHPMPESLVWIDTTSGGIHLTAQLPLNRLEFSFGKTLTDHPEAVLQRYGDALSAYLLVHVGARTSGRGWQVERPRLDIIGPHGGEELQAIFVLRAPPGIDARTLELLYDVITHEVRTHRVQVFLRNDWNSGFTGEAPILLGELDNSHRQLPVVLKPEHAGAGFASLFKGGLVHIAQGTDHLLFLLMLLLAAPLVAIGKSWGPMRAPRTTLRHTAFVITAFTVGHTFTLVLGSTGLVVVSPGPVEVAVALTIAIAAVHAWRPLFAGAETTMALGFGLIHGMAFSSSLSGAGLTPWQHAQSLLAFNLGIEAMQLLMVAAILPPLLLIGTARPAWYAVLRSAVSAIAAFMACAWVAQRTGLVDFGEPSWLGDGSVVPLSISALLWLTALACALAVKVRRYAR